MKCVICNHGETRPGRATVTMQRGDVTVIFKDVPAQVCDNCGEQYVDERVTARLLTEADQAARSGTQVEVRLFAA